MPKRAGGNICFAHVKDARDLKRINNCIYGGMTKIQETGKPARDTGVSAKVDSFNRMENEFQNKCSGL